MRAISVGHGRRGAVSPPGPLPVDLPRWLGALDALAPYLIATVAVVIARHAFASSRPATFAIIAAVALLGVGSAAMLFWDMSDAHFTWPVAFLFALLIVPLFALHVRVESRALAAPVAINLLPLAFTWAGLLTVTLLIIGAVYATCAPYPGWACAIVSPLPVILGAAPLLSLDPSRPATLTAILYIFAMAEIVSGVAWLAPERWRWLIVAVLLALAVCIIGRALVVTPHHLPGRILLLGDAALALTTGLIALAAPVLCRWLTRAGEARR